MNENSPLTEASAVVAAPITAEKRSYKTSDCILAVICLIIAYLAIRVVLPSLFSVYSTVFVFAYAAICVVWLVKEGIKPRKTSVIVFAIALLFSTVMFVTTNNLIRFIALSYTVALAIYAVYLMSSGDEAFGSGFVGKLFRTVFSLPFKSFADAPKSISSQIKRNSGASIIKNVIIGLAAAIPVTAIVFSLLFSADKTFEDMFGSLFQGSFSDFRWFIIRMFFVIPLGFYFFGLIYSNVSRRIKLETIGYDTHTITPTVIYSAVTPICVLYAMFFYGQLKYFTSAFYGALPEGYSYSEYARRGFFELFAIAVINLLVIILIDVLCKQKDGVKTKGQKVYTTIISCFTLLIIATAISKMCLYIDEYGLTPLRVYTSWFILLLTVIFVIVIIYQFAEKIKVWKPIFAAFTVMLALLCFGDIDGRIAQYNVTQYQLGNIERMDISLMYDLSDSAVKYVIPLLDDDSSYISGLAQDYIERVYSSETRGFVDFNLATIDAMNAIEAYQRSN